MRNSFILRGSKGCARQLFKICDEIFGRDKTRGNLSRKPRAQSFVESKMHEHVAGNRRGKRAGQQQTLLKSGRAMQAMLGMKKLDIAALKRAAS